MKMARGNDGLNLQKIMDRHKHCLYPLHIRHIKSNGSSQAGKLVEWSVKIPKTQRIAAHGGLFKDHRCYRCKDGEKPCVQGNPRQCYYPHARND